jgi:hypothetical protein
MSQAPAIDKALLKEIQEKLTISVPKAGMAFGLSRNASYEAAKRGDIHCVPMGRKKPVPTAWLRQKLGIDAESSR